MTSIEPLSPVNPDHFYIDADGAIVPQPWMQLRRVATAEAPPRTTEYDSSGGGNKNDPVRAVQTKYVNDTPLPQYVYGRMTSGGLEVALQARSRAYFEMSHGYEYDLDGQNIPMQVVSRFGGGADIGRGGVLATGTGFCIHDLRVPSHTIPFMPHQTGWFVVAPGQTFHARCEVYFKSPAWENSLIDGGDQGTESYYRHGGLRLDLFAVPSIGTPVQRQTPDIVGSTFDIDNPDGVATGVKPAGTAQNDVMVAFLCATGGGHSSMTAPAGWELKMQYDGGPFKLHCKIFTKKAGAAEPASYAFGVPAGIGTEGMIQIVTVRNVDYDAGFDGLLRYTRPALIFGKKETMVPSIVSYNKLALAFSFFSHTPLQGQVEQAPPPGMTELTNDEGDLISLAVAYQRNPPNPLGERPFVATEPIHVGDGRISGVITMTGPIA